MMPTYTRTGGPCACVCDTQPAPPRHAPLILAAVPTHRRIHHQPRSARLHDADRVCGGVASNGQLAAVGAWLRRRQVSR